MHRALTRLATHNVELQVLYGNLERAVTNLQAGDTGTLSIYPLTGEITK